MPAPYVFTYADAIEALIDFSATLGGGGSQQMLRGAIRTAYRKIMSAHDWTFLYAQGRIQLQAPVSTGTVVYLHSSGTFARELTLTGSTWPSDAEDWAVYLDDESIVCYIDQRKSDTVVTLDATMNPGADVASTGYRAYPRWYRLPADFHSMSRPLEETSWLLSRYVTPDEMGQRQRYYNTTGDILVYSIQAVSDLYGAMGLFVDPPSDSAETLDFVYKRRMRDLRYSGYDGTENAGSMTVTAGSATATGAGGAAFASGHVGSILRLGASTTVLPTSLDGLSPYGEQRSIIAVTSGTTATATLDANVATTRSSVKYRITDPVDLDIAAWDAFLALAKLELAKLRAPKAVALCEANYKTALYDAKVADRRTSQRVVAGSDMRIVTRLAQATNRPAATE
jgi:hypothetical protein